MPALAATPCLVGPTGSGKSDAGVLLARAAGPGSEVISCDAFAVYRGMPILTAAPDAPPDVPHRLVGILGPDEVYDAARFVTDADHYVARAREADRAALIVGGTALYLRAWLKGFDMEAPRDDAYRAQLKEVVAREGPQRLHALLAEVDAERAHELHPNDLRRIVRALEIHHVTGTPASAQRVTWSGPDRVPARVVYLERSLDDLDRRIDARTEAMFEAGLVEEVRELLAHPISPQARQVLGLAEVEALLAGTIDEAAAKASIVRRTRRFARKQGTFFRGFQGLVPLPVAPDEDAASIAKRASKLLGLEQGVG
ncbi:MAG: tRNA (adenosine(37)-N6)-dimethylallyltransferase MiaA [Planctomycetota bacterium]